MGVVPGKELSFHGAEEKTKYVSHENYFDFLSEPPTLLNIASVSIAIELWTAAGMKKLMEIQRPGYKSGVHFELEYCRLEERALRKINELLLPKELKLSITHCMMPIGLQLQQCFDHSEKEYCRFYDLHKIGGSLYWTMEGVIDQVQSLKILISKDAKGKNLKYLFKLACKYCLEEIVLELWQKVPSARKMLVDDLSKHYQNHILAYWTAVQKNEMSALLPKLIVNDSHQIYRPDLGIYENMVLLAISIGNLFAFKYFWFKLSDYEKEANLEHWVDKLAEKIKRQKYISYQTYDIYTEILFFLLAHVEDYEKQKQIIRVHMKLILRSLLFYWPLQRFFLPAILKLMDSIHIDIYAAVMKDLVLQIKEGRLTGEQFRTVWCHSPLKFQDHFLLFLNRGSKAKPFVISTLLLAGDIQTICIILKNDSVEERKAFVTKLIQYDLKRLIQSNKLHYADALLSKLLPDSDIKAFKRYIMVTNGNELCCDSVRKLNYNAADQLFKWGFQSEKEVRDFKKNLLNSNEIFISLVPLGDFDYADRFLCWCFESEQEIHQFKKEFTGDDNIFYCEKLLFRLSSLDQLGWKVFERFLDYLPCTPENVATLKTVLSKEVGHIVEAHNLIFASLLLDWCIDSIDEANQFKNELLLSRRGINTILKALQEIPVWGKTKRVLNWFSPFSREVVAKLKYTLTTKKFRWNRRNYPPENQRRALFYLLDLFVDNYMKQDLDGDMEYDWDVNNILFGRA